MTFERQPKQPQEMTEMQNEIHEYYGVRNNSCHTYTIESIDGGETWYVAATGNVHNEAWRAEAELETELLDRGYQVFYSITEAEDFLREMERDTEGELNLPQASDESPILTLDDPQPILCQATYIDAMLDDIEDQSLKAGEAVFYLEGEWIIDRCHPQARLCLVASDEYVEHAYQLNHWDRQACWDAIAEFDAATV